MPRRSPALLLVHVVWATFRRRRTLPSSFDKRLAQLLGSKALEASGVLLAAGCAADHVHVVVRLDATVALADLVQRMKGATAHDVNAHGMLAQRLAWQAGYWAESLGPGDFSALVRYVREQRAHHDDSHPAERWQESGGEPAEGGL